MEVVVESGKIEAGDRNGTGGSPAHESQPMST
jgi:hypothetical protein